MKPESKRLKQPRWMTAEPCKHDFIKLSENSLASSQAMVTHYCRLCGHRRISRHV